MENSEKNPFAYVVSCNKDDVSPVASLIREGLWLSRNTEAWKEETRLFENLDPTFALDHSLYKNIGLGVTSPNERQTSGTVGTHFFKCRQENFLETLCRWKPSEAAPTILHAIAQCLELSSSEILMLECLVTEEIRRVENVVIKCSIHDYQQSITEKLKIIKEQDIISFYRDITKSHEALRNHLKASIHEFNRRITDSKARRSNESIVDILHTADYARRYLSHQGEPLFREVSLIIAIKVASVSSRGNRAKLSKRGPHEQAKFDETLLTREPIGPQKDVALTPRSPVTTLHMHNGNLVSDLKNLLFRYKVASEGTCEEIARDFVSKVLVKKQSELPDIPPALYQDRPKGQSIIDFLRDPDGWGPYVSAGRLTRPEFRHLDPQGEMALRNWLRTNELPDGMHIPTKVEAIDAQLENQPADELPLIEGRRLLAAKHRRQQNAARRPT